MNNSPVLSVRDLSISFSHPRPAVVSVSFDLGRGELLALVGESGSGKSMTARAVLGLLPAGARASGSVTLDGTEILNADESDLLAVRGARVGLVFQEPQSALNPVRTVGWQLAEAITAHTQGRKQGRKHGRTQRAAVRRRAVELLETVEIPDAAARLDAYPHQLSGGQRQRVAIALALAGEPDVLLADEPTTALDVTVQAGILTLLDRLRETRGLSVLLITHDMGVVAEHADRVVVLRHGEVVEQGPTRRIIDAPREPYTRALIAAVPRFAAGRPDAGTSGTSGASGAVPPAAAVQDVTVVYDPRASSPALDAVTLSVAPGATLGLVGESGSGKSTLGRVIAGIQQPTGGTVTTDALVAVVPQDPASSLDPRHSVGWSVREPLDIHRVGTRAARRDRVEELLRAVHLPPGTAERHPAELSGGQRQRVAIARALALDPTLVIADEPTSALDVSVQAEVIGLLRETQRRLGFAMVFISHDLAVVSQVSDTVAVLRRGRLVEYGDTDAVFAHPDADYTRELLAAVPSIGDARVRPATVGA
ncbi:MAG: dipeptide ABC transporter ATP-binding protein [Corynebacterium sp.]|uniref:dipeptide ABC transporter ATP-binding protein n=1 Tax=Corynebacterium sp. TaxID=1720 RepID=UPI003F913CF2